MAIKLKSAKEVGFISTTDILTKKPEFFSPSAGIQYIIYDDQVEGAKHYIGLSTEQAKQLVSHINENYIKCSTVDVTPYEKEIAELKAEIEKLKAKKTETKKEVK